MAELWVVKAVCVAEKGNDEEALSYFDKALELDSKCYYAYFNLGLKEEALFYISRVLKENPNDERILKNKELIER